MIKDTEVFVVVVVVVQATPQKAGKELPSFHTPVTANLGGQHDTSEKKEPQLTLPCIRLACRHVWGVVILIANCGGGINTPWVVPPLSQRWSWVLQAR